ncbi:hypothetical protein DV532_26860 (plasmid) [Pseudomonas sp. Leaf58]|uniref:glyoxalase superfamily protein n=1 Tax=Pseudomonas sp. Leaf58 TaxID=1736226 RepID=UPI000EA98632|nr:glyoxalase superfamily protein [Pseudomonas sp. Leaf58]AYG47907.1 hypothetical protein DV532_26860 [Pseudomonas sp. Leaf58]
MSAKILKSRAKRLRHAIEKMLGIPVSHSQALELVAKEENYPHWDAACAAHLKALPQERCNPLVRELRTQIRPDWVGQYDEVFAITRSWARRFRISCARRKVVWSSWLVALAAA